MRVDRVTRGAAALRTRNGIDALRADRQSARLVSAEMALANRHAVSRIEPTACVGHAIIRLGSVAFAASSNQREPYEVGLHPALIVDVFANGVRQEALSRSPDSAARELTESYPTNLTASRLHLRSARVNSRGFSPA